MPRPPCDDPPSCNNRQDFTCLLSGLIGRTSILLIVYPDLAEGGARSPSGGRLQLACAPSLLLPQTMTSPPDLLRPFNLLDCFSFTQIVYITFTPVALFLAAYLSRTRLLLVSKVPHDPRTERRRRGRAWRAARIINESVEEELESNNAAREAQALLPAAEQIKKTSTDQLAVTPPPSRLYLVGAAGPCVALAAVDTLLVQAATSDSKDWTGVFFSFVFGITVSSSLLRWIAHPS